MRSSYAKGRAFEYRIKKLYESAGWFVVRAAGSKGVADLVAIAPGGTPVHFIQCKAHGTLPGQERERLITVARTYNATPILASRDSRGRASLYVVRADGLIAASFPE